MSVNALQYAMFSLAHYYSRRNSHYINQIDKYALQSIIKIWMLYVKFEVMSEVISHGNNTQNCPKKLGI